MELPSMATTRIGTVARTAASAVDRQPSGQQINQEILPRAKCFSRSMASPEHAAFRAFR
jgi:hypothetical protein